eukprot:TRINITY_DN1179_c0_g1_i5.p1 TRINITY_DN1179_c0_g1~~TRINITY_DN1179_c0_g1_i5.p1  ORF type:complete len:931 (-),score=-115.61 TRINITY_DN1179_c0_g1_i5:599-3184(-)
MLFVALFLVSLSRSVSPSSRGGAGDKKISIVTDLLGWWCTADGSLSLPYVKKKGWRLMKMMLVAALFYSGAAAWGGGGCSTSFGYPAPGSPVSPVDALCGSSAEIKERNEARSRANKGKKARLDSDCRPHVVEDLLESLLKSRVVRFLRRVVVSIVVGCVADALGIGNAVFFAQLSVQWVKAGKGRMGSAGMNWSQRVVIVVALWLCIGIFGVDASGRLATCALPKFRYVLRMYSTRPVTPEDMYAAKVKVKAMQGSDSEPAPENPPPTLPLEEKIQWFTRMVRASGEFAREIRTTAEEVTGAAEATTQSLFALSRLLVAPVTAMFLALGQPILKYFREDSVVFVFEGTDSQFDGLVKLFRSGTVLQQQLEKILGVPVKCEAPRKYATEEGKDFRGVMVPLRVSISQEAPLIEFAIFAVQRFLVENGWMKVSLDFTPSDYELSSPIFRALAPLQQYQMRIYLPENVKPSWIGNSLKQSIESTKAYIKQMEHVKQAFGYLMGAAVEFAQAPQNALLCSRHLGAAIRHMWAVFDPMYDYGEYRALNVSSLQFTDSELSAISKFSPNHNFRVLSPNQVSKFEEVYSDVLTRLENFRLYLCHPELRGLGGVPTIYFSEIHDIILLAYHRVRLSLHTLGIIFSSNMERSMQGFESLDQNQLALLKNFDSATLDITQVWETLRGQAPLLDHVLWDLRVAICTLQELDMNISAGQPCINQSHDFREVLKDLQTILKSSGIKVVNLLREVLSAQDHSNDDPTSRTKNDVLRRFQLLAIISTHIVQAAEALSSLDPSFDRHGFFLTYGQIHPFRSNRGAHRGTIEFQNIFVDPCVPAVVGDALNPQYSEELALKECRAACTDILKHISKS